MSSDNSAATQEKIKLEKPMVSNVFSWGVDYEQQLCSSSAAALLRDECLVADDVLRGCYSVPIANG